MSNQINDLWVSYLKDQGYTGKQYNDLIRKALQDQTGSTRKQINDLWMKYLGDLGFTGSITDRMYKWLGGKGYEGSLNDRTKQALEAGDLFTPSEFDPESLFTASDVGGLWHPKETSTLKKSDDSPVTAIDDNVMKIDSFVTTPSTIQLQNLSGIDDVLWKDNYVTAGTVRVFQGTFPSPPTTDDGVFVMACLKYAQSPTSGTIEVFWLKNHDEPRATFIDRDLGKTGIVLEPSNSISGDYETVDLDDDLPHTVGYDYDHATQTLRHFVDGVVVNTVSHNISTPIILDNPAFTLGDRSFVLHDSWGLFFRNRGGASAQEISDLHNYMVTGLKDNGTAI